MIVMAGRSAGAARYLWHGHAGARRRRWFRNNRRRTALHVRASGCTDYVDQRLDLLKAPVQKIAAAISQRPRSVDPRRRARIRERQATLSRSCSSVHARCPVL
jgi:hypothetical protein